MVIASCGVAPTWHPGFNIGASAKTTFGTGYCAGFPASLHNQGPYMYLNFLFRHFLSNWRKDLDSSSTVRITAVHARCSGREFMAKTVLVWKSKKQPRSTLRIIVPAINGYGLQLVSYYYGGLPVDDGVKRKRSR